MLAWGQFKYLSHSIKNPFDGFLVSEQHGQSQTVVWCVGILHFRLSLGRLTNVFTETLPFWRGSAVLCVWSCLH